MPTAHVARLPEIADRTGAMSELPSTEASVGSPGRDPAKAPKFSVSKLVPGEVLDQYLQGKTSKQIAEENGITRQALQAWLLREDAQGWQTAQTASAMEDVDEAIDYRKSIQTRIEKADKEERERLNIALVCARDAEKSAQWRLERVCRRIYGQDSPPSSVVPIQINIGISRGGDATNAAQHEVIEAEVSPAKT